MVSAAVFAAVAMALPCSGKMSTAAVTNCSVCSKDATCSVDGHQMVFLVCIMEGNAVVAVLAVVVALGP
eukprot:278554-Ditylum_brightwellii.AAC.1